VGITARTGSDQRHEVSDGALIVAVQNDAVVEPVCQSEIESHLVRAAQAVVGFIQKDLSRQTAQVLEGLNRRDFAAVRAALHSSCRMLSELRPASWR
jgi:hypothetical protein